MTKAVWGPATWKLLHCMVLKVNTIEPGQLIELKNTIMRIVSNLPCPYCTSHALSNIATSNFKVINNINDLKLFMFQFHNKVNQQTNKPMITYDEHLPKYTDLKMQDVLQDFLNHSVELVLNYQLLKPYSVIISTLLAPIQLLSLILYKDININ